ncbi:MAG: M23 family metallopeptidase [Ardenticatenaceae bacterium]
MMRSVLRLFVVVLLVCSVIAFRYAFLRVMSGEELAACVGTGCGSASLPSKPALPTLTLDPNAREADVEPTAGEGEAEVEPTERAVEPTEGAVEPTERAVEPTEPTKRVREVVVTVLVTSTPPPTKTPEPTPVPTETPVPTPTPLPDREELVARYGSQLFPSLEEMPEEVRAYFMFEVQEVADFFEVRSEDLIAVLQAQNEGGLRIEAPDEQAGSAQGVARISPRVWNGWANPESEQFLSDPRIIEQYGGLGFDWTMALVWNMWRENGDEGRVLSGARADPNDFKDALAAVARLLAREGLMQDEGLTALRVSYSDQEPLAEVIAQLNGEFPLANALPTSQDEPIVSPELRTAYYNLMDQTFGVGLSEEELDAIVNRSPIAAQVWNWEITVEEGANQLLQQTIEHYMAQGKAAYKARLPLPWPFIHDDETLARQTQMVQVTGHTFPPWDLQVLLKRYGDDEEKLNRRLSNRVDTRLFASAKVLINSQLNRSRRGLPVTVHETSKLMQPVLANRRLSGVGTNQMQELSDQIEYHIRTSPEYQELYGIRYFSTTPLQPMPRIIKPFGVPARYQSTGYHSGLDVRNRRQKGKEPLLYAVEDGYVVYVGPLYCNADKKCRGAHAIVIEHSNNIYTAYSHNSEAHVEAGEYVKAAQPIGRQGNEGYSIGSHLHFEVIVGCQWSGDWTTPWGNCNGFVNPLPWLPPTASW